MPKAKNESPKKRTAKKDALIEVVHETVSAPKEAGVLGRIRGKAASPTLAVHDDPKKELRRLVRMHHLMTRMSVATKSSAEDKKNRTTGQVIPSLVPEDLKVLHLELSAAYKRKAKELESDMTRSLRMLPIYKVFSREVFGLGPVVSSYLAAEVDFARCEKPSQLKRYCGFAVINGRLERPQRGVKLGYNAALRTRIFQMMAAVWKNAAKTTICENHGFQKSTRKGMSAEEKKAFQAECAECPDCLQTPAPRGYMSKYLKVWKDYKHRMLHSERFRADSNEILVGDGEWRKGGRAAIHSAGWHKAADVFLEDLYIIGRTLENRPVWPSYYAAKLGYEHLGKICVNAPRHMSLDEALALIGDVGCWPAPVTDPVPDESEEEAALEEEIERAEQEAAIPEAGELL